MWKADARGNMAPSVQYRRKNSAITAAVFCGGPSHSADALAQVSEMRVEENNPCQCRVLVSVSEGTVGPFFERDSKIEVPKENVTMLDTEVHPLHVLPRRL